MNIAVATSNLLNVIELEYGQKADLAVESAVQSVMFSTDKPAVQQACKAALKELKAARVAADESKIIEAMNFIAMLV